ncbi:UNVERIFIED_ORG: hypothetical protein ABIB52_004582 [Arthrobacter sp. UYCu721]
MVEHPVTVSIEDGAKGVPISVHDPLPQRFV